MTRPPPQTQADRERYAYKVACKTWQGYVRALGGDARNLDLDDLLGAAMLGAATALAKFDPARGTLFSTFAIAYVRFALRQEARRQDHLTRDLRIRAREIEAETGELPLWALRPESLDETVTLEVGTALRFEMLADDTVNVEAEALNRIEAETLWHWVALFPRKERQVIERYYRDGETFECIRLELGVSQAYVYELRASAVKRLRDWMAAP